MKSKASQEYRVLLIGFTVPEDVNDRICRVDRYMPVQTFKFAWSVVRGLENNGVVVDLLSSEPVGVYPSNSQVIFKFSKWDRGNETWNVIMPFINITGLRHITRFLSCLGLSIWWLIRTRRKKNRIVLIHGVHSAYMYAALVLRKLFRIKIVTIVTDPPGVSLAGEGKLRYLLRKIDSGFIIKGLQSMNGLITLTKQLSEHYAPGVPAMVMEGIISVDNYTSSFPCVAEKNVDANSGFVVLYAGGLQAEYGVQLLLEAFAKIYNPTFRLWIFGKGELATQVQAASQKDSRIAFRGFCPPEKIKDHLKKATVLINPRPSSQSFTRFSFPSKIIEYMASGRPVITTRLPGIPEDYFPYLFVLDEETPAGLSDLLTRVSTVPREDLDELGAKAKTFVLEKKTDTYQGQRILSFLAKELTNQ